VISRTVTIVDTLAPVMTLVGLQTIVIEAQSPRNGYLFPDPGATALDARDGNLTTSIIVTGISDVDPSLLNGDFTVLYSVTGTPDYLGATQTSTLTRTVIVRDRTPPSISLVGSGAIEHEGATAYIDSGVSITDNFETEQWLQDHVVVTGTDFNTSAAVGPASPCCTLLQTHRTTLPLCSES
jgi:hypothetical protein